MTFHEARTKLTALAPDKYRAVSFEISDDINGLRSVECGLYVAGEGHFNGPTFEHAFVLLRESIGIKEEASEKEIAWQAPDCAVESLRQNNK